MSCYFPQLRAWFKFPFDEKLTSHRFSYDGEPLSFWNDFFVKHPLDKDGRFFQKFALCPCGKCIGCREDVKRNWTNRIIAENLAQNRNGNLAFFVTLTYDDIHLPSDGNLHVEDLQKFFKRFRKDLGNEHLRYFACGEYGEHFLRPHYHFICWLPRSPCDVVAKCWPLGFSYVEDGSVNRFAYVAGYCSKKLVKADVYGKTKEFIVMSRRPGIGSDVDLDHIALTGHLYLPDGKIVSPPRFFKNKFSEDERHEIFVQSFNQSYQNFLDSKMSWSEYCKKTYDEHIQQLRKDEFDLKKQSRRI